MRAVIDRAAAGLDYVFVPLILPSALIMKAYRRVGSGRLTRTTELLKSLGVFPIRNHYYEPLFSDRDLAHSLRARRSLPGIDFRMDAQVALLEQLTYEEEFLRFVEEDAARGGPHAFRMDNGSFEAGDAEFLYQMVRHLKPGRVVEVGSGSSTKVVHRALTANEAETGERADHLCIEPYEQPWLEAFKGIRLLREKVEDCGFDWTTELGPGDLLFIDSSHMIRPQGDVVFEYLNLIPSLPSGVVVHVHDIFTPHDYPDEWVRDQVRFWNEQYLLEATLGNQASYEVVAAVNLLRHEHYDLLSRVCPFLVPSRDPGSFYFRVK